MSEAQSDHRYDVLMFSSPRSEIILRGCAVGVVMAWLGQEK